MITFEKETGRIVKWLDRAEGPGSIWKGLRRVHFSNGNIVDASKIATLARCPRRPPGGKPLFHLDSCPYKHQESTNPLSLGSEPAPG